ncbi:MAG: phosphotransferase [Pseudomonadota bacterium]
MAERSESLKHWLTRILESDEFELKSVTADASFRSYYRLYLNHPYKQAKTFIVMDAPPLQEDCAPFILITNILLNSDINVPRIHDIDLEQGYLLLDDLGNDLYLDKLNSDTADKLYSDAIMALVQMQTSANVSELNDYNESLLRTEMNLFSEWLLSKHLNIVLDSDQTQALELLFNLLIENVLQQPQCFVHRDFHSRNLMVTESRNPGVIDYQDAVNGPASYDLVSLLKDCYIKWPKEAISHWLSLYLDKMAEAGFPLDHDQFQRWFDFMGVQRHLKASGIFARLSHRDGKHNYLNDVPLTLSYIVDLKNTYEELIPLCLLIEESVLPRFEANDL